MEFRLLGAEIEMNWQHFAVALTTIITVWGALALVLLFAAILFALGTNSGMLERISQITGIITGISTNIAAVEIAGIFLIPILSWSLLQIAEGFKLERNNANAKSIAVALTLVFVSIIIGEYGLRYLSGSQNQTEIPIAVSMINIPFLTIRMAIIIYLWLLFFIKPSKGKVLDTAGTAVGFGTALFMVNQVYLFMLGYYGGAAYTYTPAVSDLAFVLNWALFGFIILAQCKERKVDVWAHLFAAACLIPITLISISSMIRTTPWQVTSLFSIVIEAFALVVLFTLAQMKFPEKK